MTMTSEPVAQTLPPVPEGFHTITASMVVRDAAAAIEFYAQAFGAVEIYRATSPDGRIMHGTIQIGTSKLMLSDEFPDWGTFGPQKFGGTPVSLHLYVEDADALFERAVAAGATVTMPMDNAFWGDRYGRVTDPFGHDWAIASQQRVVTEEELRRVVESWGACASPPSE
jgi:PhnB protein